MIELFIDFLSHIFDLEPFALLFACLFSLCIVLLIKRIVKW